MKFSRVVIAGVLGAVLVYAIVRVTGALTSMSADLCELLGRQHHGCRQRLDLAPWRRRSARARHRVFLRLCIHLRVGDAAGAFVEYRGIHIVVAFAVAHLAFGMTVGALYGRPLHKINARRTVWREA